MHVVFKSRNEWFGEEPKLADDFRNKYAYLLEAVRETATSMNRAAMEKGGVEADIRVSEQLLIQALIDAEDDLKRLKQYHPTKTPNPIKDMSYKAFWIVRRKPIILMNEQEILSAPLTDIAKMRFLFINEYFATTLLLNSVYGGKKEAKLPEEKKNEAEAQRKYFKRYLLYYLVYRLKSPKEIEAIMLSQSMYPNWEVNPIIWGNMEELEEEF